MSAASLGMMDKLPPASSDCAEVGNDDDDQSCFRRSLYKSKGTSQNQEERRKRLLETQKKNREQLFSKNRVELSDIVDEDECEQMEVQTSNKSKRGSKRKYVHMLMQSEWMTEVPADLEDRWVFMPCPAGKRCLVVAHGCSTRAYSYSGKPLARFDSLLPGGSSSCASGQTLLDCVWSWRQSTYYVLDVLVWRNQPFFSCETECRFFWLKNQLAELESISIIQKNNKFKFIALPFYPCYSSELTSVMNSPPVFPDVMDGVLFYHKEAHYTPKCSPLVVWLLPFMLPEVLGVSVSETLAAQCPANYPGHLDFIHHFQEQSRKQRKDDYRQRKAATRAFLEGDTSMEGQSSEVEESFREIEEEEEQEEVM